MSESTPQTSAIFVRLTRDFPQGSGHRRAGIELAPGPQPVEVEVTDEQLELLKGDRYIEIVDDAEAQKWIDRLGEPQLKTSADVLEENEQGNTGRNYGDGSGDGSGNDDDEVVPPTAEEIVDNNNRDAIIALANEAGVEGLNYDDKKATTKKVIAEAIVAKRESTETEE